MENFEWDRARRAKDILFGVAVGRSLITYGQLAPRLGCRPDHIGPILGHLSRESAAKGGPMWSALVVLAETSEPSRGFGPMAREANPAAHGGRSDREIFRVERDRCYDYAAFSAADLAPA